jgi:hypothetical protein
MPYFQIGALLEPGIRNEFTSVYTPMYAGVRAAIGDVIWMDATSDKLQEIFGFMNAPLYMVRWHADSIIPSKAVGSQRFQIINRDFGRRAVLPRNVEDDQTGTAVKVAHDLAVTAAILPEQIFYQYITGATDNTLLPLIPTSADGNNLYLTTTRYGSASGNVVSVTSTSTVQGVITDIFSVHRRFIEFQNTESQPFFDATMTKRLSIFHGSALSLVMAQAEFQTRVPWEVTAGSNGTGQTPTSVLQEAQFDIRFVNSQRITDSVYYTFLRGLPVEKRPIIRQVRKGYTEYPGNFVNSDFSRDTGQTYVQADLREGWGSALAISTIRVS